MLVKAAKTVIHAQIKIDFSSAMAVLAIVAAAGAAYAVQGRRRSGAYERVERQEASAVLRRPMMNFGYWTLSWAGRGLSRLGVPPDAISWAGLGFAAFSGAAIAAGYFGVAALAAFLSGSCDGLDGMVADMSGKKTPGGVVLDSTLDRYADFAMLFGAAYFFRGMPAAFAAALLALHGSFMVSYATAKAEAVGKTPPGGSMKRPERWVWLLAGLLVSALGRPWAAPVGVSWAMPFAWALAAVALGANVSAARRFGFLRASADGRALR